MWLSIRPVSAGQTPIGRSWSMPGSVCRWAPGMARAVNRPRLGSTIRSRSPCRTRSAHDPEKFASPVAGGEDSRELAADTGPSGWVAIPASRRGGAHRSLVERVAARADVPMHAHRPLNVFDPGARRSAEHQTPGRPSGATDFRRSGSRHDRRERCDPGRAPGGDGLRDHPAHRHADQTRRLQPERIEERDRIRGHIAEVVLFVMSALTKQIGRSRGGKRKWVDRPASRSKRTTS